LPFLVIPTNSQSETIDLGDDLRAHKRPGQRSVEIERRVGNGLFGTGIGAKWEKVPVEAEFVAGPDGRQALLIDREQLRRAVGATAADRALEMVIAMAKRPRDRHVNRQKRPRVSVHPPEPPPDLPPGMLDYIVHEIAKHAFENHREDFPRALTPGDVAETIKKIMKAPTRWSYVRDGRIAYWDRPSQTLVIVDPIPPHEGTAMKPTTGERYFDELRTDKHRR
jgi:hypothetical protein